MPSVFFQAVELEVQMENSVRLLERDGGAGAMGSDGWGLATYDVSGQA